MYMKSVQTTIHLRTHTHIHTHKLCGLLKFGACIQVSEGKCCYLQAINWDQCNKGAIYKLLGWDGLILITIGLNLKKAYNLGTCVVFP